MDENDPCFEFKQGRQIKYRTHLYFLEYEAPDADNAYDVTWVSQLSLDRLYLLEALCVVWEGPISVAVYATDAEAGDLVASVADSNILSWRKNIGYHLVYKQQVNKGFATHD